MGHSMQLKLDHLYTYYLSYFTHPNIVASKSRKGVDSVQGVL